MSAQIFKLSGAAFRLVPPIGGLLVSQSFQLIRRRVRCAVLAEKFRFRALGVLICLFSSLLIGLGISDVTLTWFYYCDQQSACGTLTDALALTWAALSIWGPIPVCLFFAHNSLHDDW